VLERASGSVCDPPLPKPSGPFLGVARMFEAPFEPCSGRGEFRSEAKARLTTDQSDPGDFQRKYGGPPAKSSLRL
jgi:hypothetical protein